MFRLSICRERRFGKMSQINSGESLDTADEYSAPERDRKQQEPEKRLSLKERQARRSGEQSLSFKVSFIVQIYLIKEVKYNILFPLLLINCYEMKMLSTCYLFFIIFMTTGVYQLVLYHSSGSRN